MNEKRTKKEQDDRANRSYMNKWTVSAEQESNRRKAVEINRQDKIKQTQNFLIEQIQSNPNTLKNASDIKLKKKFELGGQMNPEEARMNRALLKEIAMAKKEGVSVRLGSATYSQAI